MVKVASGGLLRAGVIRMATGTGRRIHISRPLSRNLRTARSVEQLHSLPAGLFVSTLA
jgi:hypothetical protein